MITLLLRNTSELDHQKPSRQSHLVPMLGSKSRKEGSSFTRVMTHCICPWMTLLVSLVAPGLKSVALHLFLPRRRKRPMLRWLEWTPRYMARYIYFFFWKSITCRMIWSSLCALFRLWKLEMSMLRWWSIERAFSRNQRLGDFRRRSNLSRKKGKGRPERLYVWRKNGRGPAMKGRASRPRSFLRGSGLWSSRPSEIETSNALLVLLDVRSQRVI